MVRIRNRSLSRAVESRRQRIPIMRAVCGLMLTFLLTFSFWGGWVPVAHAVGSQEAAAVVKDRAVSELDRVAGAGTSNQVEGTVDSLKGEAKRNASKLERGLDSATDNLEGSADELKGKIKRDIGRTQSAADELTDKAEDATGGVVESIKDFFN